MNIREAKNEIKDTIEAYLLKDETGSYVIPVEKQRPILLMGPPGIGKTAIMEQVSRECGINLVAYTITHHTRQSAIGLPFIREREYGGRNYSVTEYTMSEIVASIYEQIEKSGIQEGILFLDEINCVSETLAPTMLQFLQYKSFGTHRIPDGFVIVTAGNPPEYNKSVRDMDVVTLDRVKKIDIDADFEAWKEYAYKTGVHGSILAYLEIRRENFYHIRTEVSGRRFVTARGWEDLSRLIQVYEKLGKPVTANTTVQYLQDPEIAEDFAVYYELYRKYRDVYRIPEILSGWIPEEKETMQRAPFDEKLSLIGLLIDSLGNRFRSYAEDLELQRALFGILKEIKTGIKDPEMSVSGVLKQKRMQLQHELDRQTEAALLDKEQIRIRKKLLLLLSEAEKEEYTFAEIKAWFGKREAERKQAIEDTGNELTNAFTFLEQVFGEGQEMVIFLTELTAGYYSLKYVRECGNDTYYKFNRLLLMKDRRTELREDLLTMMEV
ncbi:MAG: AAA family ATPase [Eubacteriales bacterium]|nr:AAA family ATPase [Eubacteriales bacterium]